MTHPRCPRGLIDACSNIQLLESVQHKGVGMHLMNLVQLIARKEGLSFVSIVVPDGCVPMETFIVRSRPAHHHHQPIYTPARTHLVLVL